MPKHLLHNLIPSAMSPPCQNWDRTLKKKILPHVPARELPLHLKSWLSIPPLLTLELAEHGWPRNEPCPPGWDKVPETALTRGPISCRVPGERAAVLRQEKQGWKSD